MALTRTPPLQGRGIDHLVLCVRDLDAASSVYEKLGFTLTPRASHDWGTDNRLVQMGGCFLEIIEVAHPEKMLPPAPRQFRFGSFIETYLQQREGFGMLVFESHDAAANRDEFAAKGLSDFDRFDFERQAKLPDGSAVTVGFSLAFVSRPEAPDAAFFVCQQHAPQYFWKPDYQRHANGAAMVGEVVMVANDPARLRPLFAGLQQPESVSLEDGILRTETARGWVTAMTPANYETWFGAPAMNWPERPEGPHLAAFRVVVSDLSAVEKQLQEQSFSYHWAKGGLTIPPEQLFGVTLSFVQGDVTQSTDASLPALPAS